MNTAPSTNSLPDWADAEELPRAGLPDARRLARRARLYRWWVKASVFLLPLACLSVLVALRPEEPDSGAEVTELSSPGRAAATAALIDWLNTDPAPIPGGRVLGWEGATVLTDDAHGHDSDFDVTVTIEQFTVVDNSGTVYRAQVQVASDARNGSVVVAGPSLIPVPAALDDGWDDGVTWPGRSDSAQVPEPVTRSVQLWAEAFTSGDPETLRLAVGDPDPDHSFVPLPGAVGSVAKPVAATVLDNDSSLMVVRVELVVVREGMDREDPASLPAPMVMDVLVERADSAAPVVVAWGGPGTGPTLERYGNAVLGDRDLTTTKPVDDTTGGDETADENDMPPSTTTTAPKKETTTTTAAPKKTKTTATEGGA